MSDLKLLDSVLGQFLFSERCRYVEISLYIKIVISPLSETLIWRDKVRIWISLLMNHQ